MDTLYVKQIGDGNASPIILLHGWANTHEALHPLGLLLGTKRRILLVDLPGFGNSPPPPPHFGGDQFANLLHETLKPYGTKKAILVGHSFGGKIACHMAALFPEHYSGLTLIAASGLKKQKSLKTKSTIAFGKSIKALDRILRTGFFENYFVPRFASKDYQAAHHLRQILVRSVNEDSSRAAVAVKLPTLLLWGEQDTETPISLGKKYHSLIQGSELICYPQCGHHPFEDVGSHLVFGHIQNFLNRRGL